MSRKKQLNGSAEETELAFYDAISRADIHALMALWAEDEEIVCIHPGSPRLIGHAAIRASWTAIFARGNVHIRPILLHATHNLMAVIHNIVEEVKRSADEPEDAHILTTNVYLKTPRGWRITIHHASIAPGKAQTEQKIDTILH
jgi:ketosteroid isomerase-like protein